MVLLRSTTKKRPSCFTTREWRFDTLPLLSTMSLPGTRPTVTSSRSKSMRLGVPPFSVTISVNIEKLVSYPVARYAAAVASIAFHRGG